ncbi:MAG: alpha/beta fold hydrolase [Thermonemataceae bacterium]
MSTTVIMTALGEIEYRSVGKGTPILFLHGGHSNCQETLSYQGFDLEKYQLITPSRPGYGKTPLGNNKTPQQAASLMIALLEHLALEKIIVYGISAGGLTAIALAANHPRYVTKLILASAVSKKWLQADEKIYKTAQWIFNPSVEKITWGMVRVFSNIFPTMIARSFYPQFSTKPLHKLAKKDVKTLITAMKYYSSGSGFLNDIDQSISDSALAAIQCPTFIIHSKNDSSVPFEHALQAKEMIDDAKLVALNNEWGHLFWIGSDTQEIIVKTIQFIEG